MTSKPVSRPALSLDGEWDFAFEGSGLRLEGATIRAPGIWQAQFPQLRNAPGAGRYRRRVTLPPAWRGKRIHLVMEGVFHETVVSVDGVEVSRHGDGWTTLDADLTEAVAGLEAFDLDIAATLPDERGLGRASLGETFAAKQDWYGLQGGIWKPARLEARAPLHIAELDVQTLCEPARARAKGRLSLADAKATLRLTLRRDGATVAQAEFTAGETFDCSMAAGAVALWSPQTPALYELESELIEGGAVVDALTRTVGFRRFEAREGRLWLNGEPFLMFGALDQDWHPQEECRPPDPAFLEQRFRNAKAMGLNTLRCHVKIPDRLYLDLADRLGLLVWLDMPYCEYLTPRARETVERIFKRSVAEHAHHPSIVIWTLFNEGWGIDLDDNASDRAWLKRFFDEAKPLVEGSLVIDNSPCFPRNYHMKTDIEDFHWYNGFPHQNADFAATTQAFAGRARFPWSPHGDAEIRGSEPLICSEFGVWGLPHPRDIRDPDGAEPWWFESGHDWNLGAAYPHGVETRFRDSGLKTVFGELDSFVEAAQAFQFRGLKDQIEALRWESALSGYVITELNDTQWEANGLMDARNNPRRFASHLAELQTPWLALARLRETAVACGKPFEVEARLAGPGTPPPGARLVWRWNGESGEIPANESPTRFSLRAPDAAAPRLAELELEAFDGAGRSLSRNSWELCLTPPLADAPALAALDEGAAAILTALNWPRAEAPAIWLATRMSGRLREKLLAGGRVVLVANSAKALQDPQRRAVADRHNFPRMALREREDSVWDGRWMGGFAWRRTDGAWARLPGGPMLDEHWRGLTPKFVLTGYLSTSHAGLVDAGIVVAWVHHGAGFVKRTRLGPGRLTVSTFALNDLEAIANPLAPYLLAAIAGPETDAPR